MIGCAAFMAKTMTRYGSRPHQHAPGASDSTVQVVWCTRSLTVASASRLRQVSGSFPLPPYRVAGIPPGTDPLASRREIDQQTLFAS